MSAHTAGPWYLDGGCVYGAGDLKILVAIPTNPRNTDRADTRLPTEEEYVTEQANRKLIAAAPELLDACGLALDDLNQAGKADSRTAEVLKNAIAKAVNDADA